ncbi:hypothetical protein DY000_02012473 [Brassica cretica]|uniref:Uncharacterized protein n=1 Tax=Brassica cretica TaxID=69181 RepID=A0ABQ7CU37_BRACR|nr:hypothetical protein DY000_02012473 [Brassica cretica]
MGGSGFTKGLQRSSSSCRKQGNQSVRVSTASYSNGFAILLELKASYTDKGK